MLATPQLPSILAECWNYARQVDGYVLEWKHRHRIWQQLGPRRLPGTPPTEAHNCRARIAAACAKRVLPVWEERWALSLGPRRAIETIDEALRRWSDPGLYSPQIIDCAGEVDGVIMRSPLAWHAGTAALRALAVAVGDEDFEESGEPLAEGDAQTGGPNDDAASHAAVAAARGNALDASSDSHLRLEFWRWYLEEAVPTAVGEAPIRLGE